MASPTPQVVLLHAEDDVCVAARDLAKGEQVAIGDKTIVVREHTPMGHKLALKTVAPGEPVTKFGHTIGFASLAISPGHWVHVHNLTGANFDRSCEVSTAIPPAPMPISDRTFQGFRRPDGKAGTRNYVAVISTVNCSASVSRWVVERFDKQTLADFPNVDGVMAATHNNGCGMPFGGIKHENITRVLGGLARHPNIGAYLLIGLGCEQGSMDHLLENQGLVQLDVPGQTRPTPPVLVMQDLGGTQATVEAAIEKVAELLPVANGFRREKVPASELILATECGGSDGNSGVTANPAVGVAVDRLIACGGSAILSETSEIYGAEQLLTRRARTPAVAEKLMKRIHWWEWYAEAFGAKLDNNPTGGNKAGGLTTIYEKSLGAVAKAGSTALEAVYEYAEPVTSKGLVVMDSPSFDPISITGKVAGGANLVAFTTGRGSCYGCKPVPSFKIASNTALYERMSDDMDFDAGVVLSQGRSIESVGEELFDRLLAIASGEKTKSEQHGYGDNELSPWEVGPTL